MRATEEHYSEGTLLLIVVVAIAVFSLANLPIIDRSIWVDEAMLLSNFWDKTSIDLLSPLPYYDQSTPPLPALLLNLTVKSFGTNIIATRYCLVIVVLISLIYTVVNLARHFGLSYSLMAILTAISTWQILLYASEIKHYGFEIAGSFLIVGWIIHFFAKPDIDLKASDICLLLIGLLLGFSTLFPFLCAWLMIIARMACNSEGDIRITVKTAIYLLLLLACGIAYKFAIDYYSQFQIQANFDVYSSNAGPRNLKRLFRLLDPLVKVAIIMGVVHLLFRVFNMQKISVKALLSNPMDALLIFGLLSMAMVATASFLGLYPAIAPRQLVWALPAAITIIALVTCHYLPVGKSAKALLFLLISLLIGLNIAHSAVHLINFKERNANKALYTTLNQQQPSTVLLHFAAQPSFDIYRDIIPGLHKHRYIGRYNRENGALIDPSDFKSNYASYIETTPGAYSSMVYFRQNKDYDVYSDWAVNINKDTPTFYVVFSHYKDYLRESFIEALNRRQCSLKTIFNDVQVELLEANCNE